MTYEECEQLVSAFEKATLLTRELPDTSAEKRMAADCADAIGEFIASMMAQAWKLREVRDD